MLVKSIMGWLKENGHTADLTHIAPNYLIIIWHNPIRRTKLYINEDALYATNTNDNWTFRLNYADPDFFAKLADIIKGAGHQYGES